VDAGNYVTSCDLRIFVDQAAEPVSPQNAHTGHSAGGQPADPGSAVNFWTTVSTPRPRNTTLVALVEELPAPILADVLGLHINTSVR
jgi:hypothetical protein